MSKHSNLKSTYPTEEDGNLQVGKDVFRRILVSSLLAFVAVSLLYIIQGNTTVVLAAVSYVIAIGGIVIFILAKDYDRRHRIREDAR